MARLSRTELKKGKERKSSEGRRDYSKLILTSEKWVPAGSVWAALEIEARALSY